MIFTPFIAFVIDENDPERNGRYKIRIMSENYNNVSDEELPWATVMLPATSTSQSGMGISPGGLIPGTCVFGMYLDGNNKSKPMIIGTIPLVKRNGDENNNDINELFRAEKIIQKTLSPGEPESKAAPKYPYNKVFKSRSGHIIEIDDTTSAERIHIFHKSGSYIEMTPDGNIVAKSNGSVEVSTNGKEIHVNNGDFDIKLNDGDFNLESKDIKIDSKDINVNSDNVNVNAKSLNITTIQDLNINSATKISFVAPKISILGSLSLGK